MFCWKYWKRGFPSKIPIWAQFRLFARWRHWQQPPVRRSSTWWPQFLRFPPLASSDFVLYWWASHVFFLDGAARWVLWVEGLCRPNGLVPLGFSANSLKCLPGLQWQTDKKAISLVFSPHWCTILQHWIELLCWLKTKSMGRPRNRWCEIVLLLQFM